MKNQTTFLRLLVFLAYVLAFVNISASDNVKKSINDGTDDTDETNEETKDESLDIPVEGDNTNLTCTRRANSQMHEIRSARVMQFPFVVAIMSHQNEYQCAGSVVSNGMILTSAKCTQLPVAYVILNATRDHTSEYTKKLYVVQMVTFPTYGAESLMDVGIIYVDKHNSSVASKIKLSNYTNARNLVDIEAIGFGLNAETGKPKDMQYIGMELRSPIESNEIFRAYFDCVETKVPTCFKDVGGPAIYDNELIGIVTQGQEDCTKEMSSMYAINKKMADILPTFTFKAWLDDLIEKNEKGNEIEKLTVYPVLPKETRRLGSAEPRFSQKQYPVRRQLTSRSRGWSLKSCKILILVIALFYIAM